MARRERVGVRKGRGKQPWYAVVIAPNGRLTWRTPDGYLRRSDAVKQAKRYAAKTGAEYADRR